MRLFSGTGFSREEAGVVTFNFAVWHPTLSRLKPVPQKACGPSQCMQSHWLHAVIQRDRLQPGRGRFDQPQFRGVTADAFPAKAGPTKALQSQSMHAVPLAACGQSGTGFSREAAGVNTLNLAVWHPALSRLKRGVASGAFPAKAGPTKSRQSQSMHAVPLAACRHSVGPASAGKRPVRTP